MFIIWHILLLLRLISEGMTQTGGTTVTGDSYQCVPTGYCNNNAVPPSTGIDPRIITAGPVCAAGLIPCYTQGPSSRCGQRLVTPIFSADGQTTPQTNPWQAFIRSSGNYIGSGVLLDNYHILTAAHKVANVSNTPNLISVSMGVGSPTDTTAETITAAQIRVHPNYDGGTFYKNDIAIIRVATPFHLSSPNINTACLPPANATNNYINQICIVAGWGETAFQANNEPSAPIRQVNVRVVDFNTCRSGYLTVQPPFNVDSYLDNTGAEICAGGEANRDACTYDGGAPLTCPAPAAGPVATVAGLVIWGKGCGLPGVYGTYVYVPFYRAWIDSTITALNSS